MELASYEQNAIHIGKTIMQIADILRMPPDVSIASPFVAPGRDGAWRCADCDSCGKCDWCGDFSPQNIGEHKLYALQQLLCKLHKLFHVQSLFDHGNAPTTTSYFSSSEALPRSTSFSS